MAKGIQKIGIAKGEDNAKVVFNDGEFIGVEPNKRIWFKITEWFPGTTEADKKRDIVWIRQNNKRKVIINQLRRPAHKVYGYGFTRKECGIVSYYIEASSGGKPDFKNKVGLYVFGYCPQKITNSRWSRSAGGKDIRKEYQFSYGENVNLALDTEGLNGRNVTVELYRMNSDNKIGKALTILVGGNVDPTADDKQKAKYVKIIEVKNGEVNIVFTLSSAWRSGNDEDKFYVKVRDHKNKYISDGKDEIHARFLRVKNKIIPTKKEIIVPINNTITKVYKPDVNAARYESCKFEKVMITDFEIKDGKKKNFPIILFDNGKGIKQLGGNQEVINRTIYFKFDKTVIDYDGEAILNNILQFLLEHKNSTMNLSGHACVIGKENYNKGLSQRRADVVKKFFSDGKLDPQRIVSIGKGEVDPTDDRMGRDNLKYRDEKSYQTNRRVDISFKFNAHDANTLTFETIAPTKSTKKELIIDVTGLDAKSCFRANNKHTKEIYIVDVGQSIDKGDTKKFFEAETFKYEVYSPLNRYNPAGALGFDNESSKIMQYIWPASSSPNQFHLHIHSCRYYSKQKRTTVLIKAYADIKWTFAFFINLSHSSSIKWQKLSPERHRLLRREALRLGHEEKGNYTDVDFGVQLKASFDKQLDESYYSNPELTGKYSDKISKLFSTISSLKKIAQGITGGTKGKVSTGIGRKLPFDIKLDFPAVYLGADWEADVNDKHNVVGTKLRFFLETKPFIELAIVFDLLSLVVQAGVGVVTGGTGNVLALEIFNKVRNWAEKGYESEKVEIKFRMFIDLEIKGKVDGIADVNYSTVRDGKEINFELKSNITVELKAGLELKGRVVIIGTTNQLEPEAEVRVGGTLSAGVSVGITSSHKLKYESSQGIYYIPGLQIDPCVGQVILFINAGFTYKKISADWKPVNYNGNRVFFEGFDIIENLAKITGSENKLLLWDKNKK